MTFFDLLIGGLLAYALFKGIQNGLFAELASLVSLVIGIYIAVKFSAIMASLISSIVHWNPYTIKTVAFVLTFIVVVVGIYMLSKFFTGLADFAYLGWINKVGGGVFRVLKAILIISIFLTIFEKINYHNFLAKKETLDKSLFFNPIQKTADFLFPSLEKLYEKAKK
ncbi:colicin V production protein [Flavobacterium sp. LM5]|jgi:membrane protein required for colicin V production|uniref:CvpA family protein n=1 Tax=Flavobacterium sp. LM5 TaxID=1938610 RepID=UPI000993B633|nr:CvpA family protein [Flavobacterium sp. LM5]OOV28568.1 colicin V production protein [Flavobacterium sp. LM5]